jgi:choline-sulfatase
MRGAAKDFNVLLCISDQHRRDVTGCYGNDVVRTPNIDRLAERGIVFDNAYCQSPLCGPSRSSLLTGTYPHTCNAFAHGRRSALREDLPTLGSVFRDAGYATASIGKVHIRGEDRERRDLGFDERALRYYTYNFADYIEAIGKENVDRYWSFHKGSTHTEENPYNLKNQPIALDDEKLMFDALVTDRCIDFMERHRDNRWFLWMGIEKPHPMWFAPSAYHEMYRGEDMELPPTFGRPLLNLPKTVADTTLNAWFYPHDEVRNAIAAYYANVTYLDAKVGETLDALEQLGLADKTIVIYSTDHGELLFEHSLVQKHCFFEPAVAVPLVVANPEVLPAGVRRDGIAGLIDLFPTLTELVGIDAPATLEGTSLADVIGDRPDPVRAALSEFYAKGPAERMIRTGPWKYVYTQGDQDQLYNHEDDPLELRNLAVEPEYADRCAELRARLVADWDLPDVADFKRY